MDWNRCRWLIESFPQEDGSPFDHSVPYPSAPLVDHGDESQEHYAGARDPELIPPNKRITRVI